MKRLIEKFKAAREQRDEYKELLKTIKPYMHVDEGINITARIDEISANLSLLIDTLHVYEYPSMEERYNFVESKSVFSSEVTRPNSFGKQDVYYFQSQGYIFEAVKSSRNEISIFRIYTTSSKVGVGEEVNRRRGYLLFNLEIRSDSRLKFERIWEVSDLNSDDRQAAKLRIYKAIEHLVNWADTKLAEIKRQKVDDLKYELFYNDTI